MKVLIVNFDFPPNQGIGGRRWAKLAKGLAIKGIEVHVIKADPVKNNIDSPWTRDIQHERIHVHSLPRQYPESVSHPGRGVLAKLRYIADMRGLKQYRSGTIYDLALHWEEKFLAMASALIRNESITHLMVSGAPFNLLYYSAKLRDVFPALKILADYRDPWLTARNYGMPSLSPEMMEAERNKQQLVFDLADVISAPYPQLLQTMMHEDLRLKEHQPKFKLLPHFYDEDDIPPNAAVKTPGKIVLIYAGALYMEAEENLNRLSLAIENHSGSHAHEIEVKLYTDSTIPNNRLFALKEVKVSKGIGKSVFDEVRNANLCLLIMAEHNCHFLTTKVMEYLPLRTPFLYLGPDGEVANFIRENRLGYCPENIISEWPDIIRQVENGNPGFNDAYDCHQHSLTVATQRLQDILQ